MIKVLFLSYSPQESFLTFNESARTKCPWIDSLLDEFVNQKSIMVALAVPVDEKLLKKDQNKGLKLYGLPNPIEKNIFRKIYRNFNHIPERDDINYYAVQVINDFNPDIIQIFGSENPFGLLIPELTKPVIIYIQGFLSVCKGKWYSGISKWEQFRYARLWDLLRMTGCYNEYYTFSKRAEREVQIVRNCCYFIGRTEFDKRIVSFLSPHSEYYHCNELIRSNFFKNKWDLQLGKTIKCISILKGTTYKGIELVLQTFMILRKQSSLLFEVKICGVSKEEEIVRIISRKFNIDFDSLNIRFLGKLDCDDLIEQLCKSNIYINPSHIENSPNSVCEAMLLGMPVISTNVGGITSLITDSVDGILVQEGEPYSMAAAIMELVNNYDLAKSLGCKARERSIQRHDPKRVLEELLKIYSEILS